jgi:integrase/recombinase XerD
MQLNIKKTTTERYDRLPRQARARAIIFLENLKQKNKSPHTIKSYENDLLQFLEWNHSSFNLKLEKIDAPTISSYLDFLTNGGEIKSRPSLVKFIFFTGLHYLFFGLGKMKQKLNQKNTLVRIRPLGISSKKRHLSCLKNFFEFLKQTHEGHSKKFKNNPIKDKIHGIKLKEIDVDHTHPLLPSHWEKINDTLYRVEEKFLANLLYFGGLRLSEAQSLNIEDFDFGAKTLLLKRKGGYKHQLKIQNSRKIFEQLDLYLAKKRNILEGALFTGRDGKRAGLKTMYNRVMKILEKSKLPQELTPHSFRRACATNLYLQTKDLLLVRDYLNHHDAKITQTYIDSNQIINDREAIHPDLDFPQMRNNIEINQMNMRS